MSSLSISPRIDSMNDCLRAMGIRMHRVQFETQWFYARCHPKLPRQLNSFCEVIESKHPVHVPMTICFSKCIIHDSDGAESVLTKRDPMSGESSFYFPSSMYAHSDCVQQLPLDSCFRSSSITKCRLIMRACIMRSQLSISCSWRPSKSSIKTIIHQNDKMDDSDICAHCKPADGSGEKRLSTKQNRCILRRIRVWQRGHQRVDWCLQRCVQMDASNDWTTSVWSEGTLCRSERARIAINAQRSTHTVPILIYSIFLNLK